MAEAKPEQKTNISAASLGPNRAGMNSVTGLPGTWATRMMAMARPRKTSRRGSRPALGATFAALIGARQRCRRVEPGLQASGEAVIAPEQRALGQDPGHGGAVALVGGEQG